jgi:hypothetical protein
MKNPLRVKILQTTNDLGRERLGDLLVELSVLEETASYGTTRDVFQEAIAKIRCQQALT